MMTPLYRASCCAIVAMMSIAMVCADTQDAHANDIRQAGKLGIGLGGGTSASGLSLKYFVSDSQAFQFTLGGWYRGFGVGADYLLEMPELLQAEVLDIAWSVGLGAGIGVGGSRYYNYDRRYDDRVLSAAVSGIAGLEFLINPLPIDVVLEWRPTLSVVPGIGLGLFGASGHIRFFF